MIPLKVLTPKEILERLKDILDLENDNQLADYLGMDRQQISQYKNGKGGNINCRFISILIEEINKIK